MRLDRLNDDDGVRLTEPEIVALARLVIQGRTSPATRRRALGLLLLGLGGDGPAVSRVLEQKRAWAWSLSRRWRSRGLEAIGDTSRSLRALDGVERAELTRLDGLRMPEVEERRLKSRVVLAAWRGWSAATIAGVLDLHPLTVARWVSRFARDGLAAFDGR